MACGLIPKTCLSLSPTADGIGSGFVLISLGIRNGTPSGTPVANRHNQPHAGPGAPCRIGIGYLCRLTADLCALQSGARQRCINLQYHGLCHGIVSPFQRCANTRVAAETQVDGAIVSIRVLTCQWKWLEEAKERQAQSPWAWPSYQPAPDSV